MTKHSIVQITVLVAVVAIIGIALFSHDNSDRSTTLVPSTSSETSVVNTSGASSTSTTTTSASNAIPATTYTLADVQSHNVATSCWTTINGNVYDLTQWIAKHPGGSRAIIGLCGTDGSQAFNSQHGRNADAVRELVEYRIGVLGN
jgi:cytochrome b involved in lipid metabolism